MKTLITQQTERYFNRLGMPRNLFQSYFSDIQPPFPSTLFNFQISELFGIFHQGSISDLNLPQSIKDILKMPKGHSYQNDTWNSFEKGDYTLLSDDFVHSKTFTMKAKVERESSGIYLKESFNEKRQGGLASSGQTKFWFNFGQNRSLFTKIDTDNKVRFSYDHGVQEGFGVKRNFQASLLSNRSLNENRYRVSATIFNDQYLCGLFLKFNSVKNNFSLGSKANININGWRLNSYLVSDITSKKLTQFGFLLGKISSESSKNNFFLRISGKPDIQQGQKLQIFDFIKNITLNCSRNLNETTSIGLEATASGNNIENLCDLKKNCISECFSNIWLGGQWKFPSENITIKARINHHFTSSFTVKHKLSKFGYYSLGVEASEIGTKNKLKFGAQLDLNL